MVNLLRVPSNTDRLLRIGAKWSSAKGTGKNSDYGDRGRGGPRCLRSGSSQSPDQSLPERGKESSPQQFLDICLQGINESLKCLPQPSKNSTLPSPELNSLGSVDFLILFPILFFNKINIKVLSVLAVGCYLQLRIFLLKIFESRLEELII